MEEEKIKVIYKEKKQPGKTFAIVVLIIVVLGLMSYIGYTKYDEIMKNKDKNETKEEREEVLGYLNRMYENLKRRES